MKIRCIKNDSNDITKGKDYLVYLDEYQHYLIENDIGIIKFYNKNCFEITKDFNIDNELLKQEDTINPKHYLKYNITPTKYIIENKLDFLEGNVIKYVTRHKDKNREEDIKKAIRYLEIMLENYKNIY